MLFVLVVFVTGPTVEKYISAIEPSLGMCYQRMESDTKWATLCRRSFQMHFVNEQ